MSAPYSIVIGDRAGAFLDEEVPTFEALLVRAGELRRQYPDKVHCYFGDGAEMDGDRVIDGLTEEEREALAEGDTGTLVCCACEDTVELPILQWWALGADRETWECDACVIAAAARARRIEAEEAMR